MGKIYRTLEISHRQGCPNKFADGADMGEQCPYGMNLCPNKKGGQGLLSLLASGCLTYSFKCHQIVYTNLNNMLSNVGQNSRKFMQKMGGDVSVKSISQNRVSQGDMTMLQVFAGKAVQKLPCTSHLNGLANRLLLGGPHSKTEASVRSPFECPYVLLCFNFQFLYLVLVLCFDHLNRGMVHPNGHLFYVFNFQFIQRLSKWENVPSEWPAQKSKPI